MREIKIVFCPFVLFFFRAFFARINFNGRKLLLRRFNKLLLPMSELYVRMYLSTRRLPGSVFFSSLQFLERNQSQPVGSDFFPVTKTDEEPPMMRNFRRILLFSKRLFIFIFSYWFNPIYSIRGNSDSLCVLRHAAFHSTSFKFCLFFYHCKKFTFAGSLTRFLGFSIENDSLPV